MASPFIEFDKQCHSLLGGWSKWQVLRLGKEIQMRKIKDDAIAYPSIQKLKLNLEEMRRGYLITLCFKEIYEQQELF